MKSKKILSTIILLITILGFSTISNAALESKAGQTSWQTIANNQFVNIRKMEKNGGTLGVSANIDETTNKITDYYKQNSEEYKNLQKYKNEIEKLERRKSVLYSKKCDKKITIEEFKEQYEKIKTDINKFKIQIEEIENNNKSDLDEKRIREIITDYKNGKEITNEFLKSIIKRIEVYSNLKVEIIFNL